MRQRTRLLMFGAATAIAAGTAALAGRRRTHVATPRPTLDALARSAEAPTIIVLGAGFAGVYAARELARLLPDVADGRIVLVDETSYLLFTPMLTEVAGGEIDLHDVTTSVRRLSPRVTFIQARVEKVDLDSRQVQLITGLDLSHVPPVRHVLRADHLILALGAVTNFHHVAGLEDYALTIKSVAEAGAIHDQTLELLERAAAEPDEPTRRALLTFVVAGGGFSGVETMAALNSFVRALAPTYAGLRSEEVRTVLVHPHDRLLPELGDGLAAYAQRQLEARGVEVILNTEIDGAGPGYVDLQGQPRLRSYTLIWTAGVTPSPVVRELPCKHGEHHGVLTDSACRVPDVPGVWAVGDSAEVPHPGGGTYTATAQNATRQGTQVARNVVATLRGKEVKPFVYRPIGELAVVGKRAAVADVYGLRLSGLPAWLLWRAVYLAKEPNVRKRIRTAMDWLFDLTGPLAIPEVPGARTTPAAGADVDAPGAAPASTTSGGDGARTTAGAPSGA